MATTALSSRLITVTLVSVGEAMEQHAVHSLTLGSIYALLAVGLTLIYGAQRSLYLAYGGLYAVGAYVVWWAIRSNQSIALALGLAMVLCAALGVILIWGWRIVSQRRSESLSFLHGLGVLVCLAEGSRLMLGSYHRKVIAIDSHQIYHLGPLMFSDMHWLVLGCAFACLICLHGFLTTRPFGQALLAFLEGQEHTGHIQNSRQRSWLRGTAFALGAALAGVSGVLAGLYMNNVHPAMGVQMTHKIVGMMLIGTLGRLRGAVLSAYGLALVEGVLLPAIEWPVPSEAILLVALMLVSLRHAFARIPRHQPLTS